MVTQKLREAACLVPARIGSRRFPRKPLAVIDGQTMISRVAQNAGTAFGIENTFVVTDSLEVMHEVESVGANCLLADHDFETGTDRIASVASKFENYSWVFNVQGDEPALEPRTMTDFAKRTMAGNFEVTNAFVRSRDYGRVQSPNSIKLAISKSGRLMFASRSVVPSLNQTMGRDYFLQVCIYGFKPSSLKRFSQFPRRSSGLEIGENIEVLRFLDMGLDVGMFEVDTRSHPVDVPGDIETVEKILALKFGKNDGK